MRSSADVVGRLGAAGATLAFGAMVATPLAPRGGSFRRRAATSVVVGLAGATFDRLHSRQGAARAGAAAAAVTTVGWAAEAIGTRTGMPFGRYEYTGRLRPTVAGVPVLVPLAWFAMAVPSRETAHAVLGARSSPARRVLLGAAALTAWDLFLDPQMVGEGYWRWARPGRYRGIPLSNLGGWLVTAAAVVALLELTAPPDDRPDAALVAEYGAVAAMETLGFAIFFRDRLVAVVGGLAMLPLATAAAIRAGRLG